MYVNPTAARCVSKVADTTITSMGQQCQKFLRLSTQEQVSLGAVSFSIACVSMPLWCKFQGNVGLSDEGTMVVGRCRVVNSLTMQAHLDILLALTTKEYSRAYLGLLLSYIYLHLSNVRKPSPRLACQNCQHQPKWAGSQNDGQVPIGSCKWDISRILHFKASEIRQTMIPREPIIVIVDQFDFEQHQKTYQIRNI